MSLTLLCLISFPAHGMWRSMLRITKSLASFGMMRNSIKTSYLKQTPSFMSNSRGFFTFKNTPRIRIAPQWHKTAWRYTRIAPLVSTLAATVYFAPKAYAQSKEKTYASSMPAASLWRQIAQGATLSRNAMIESFIDDCTRREHENSLIPQHGINNETVRMATYNVHMWKDAYGTRNFDAILDTITKMNADVLVLQEVHMFDRATIMNALLNHGYTYVSAGQTTTIGGKFFGNMVVSKYPFAQKPVVKTYDEDQKYAGERRCYIKATVQLPHDKKITVYGTHLDVYDQTENLRTAEINELVQDMNNTKENCMIAADFNAVRKQDYQYYIENKSVWDMLNSNNKKRTGIETQTKALETLQHNKFTDSFTKHKQECPRYTVWSGTAVDFMYLNEAWQLPIANNYVYQSSASDHLPIIMDITINKAQN